MSKPPIPAPGWRCKIEAHAVAPRWLVPKWSGEVRAVDEDHARLEAVREAHRRAGIAPWKPAQRESLPRTTAKPIAGLFAAEQTAQAPEPAQLSLGLVA